MHRSERAKTCGIVLNDTPVAKRLKMVDSEPTASETDAYERHKTKMKQIYQSNKWSCDSLSSLLDETHGTFISYEILW